MTGMLEYWLNHFILLHLSKLVLKLVLKLHRLKVPAEVILLSSEAVVDVTNQEGGGGLAYKILKVMSDRVEGLLLGPVYRDNF